MWIGSFIRILNKLLALPVAFFLSLFPAQEFLFFFPGATPYRFFLLLMMIPILAGLWKLADALKGRSLIFGFLYSLLLFSLLLVLDAMLFGVRGDSQLVPLSLPGNDSR